MERNQWCLNDIWARQMVSTYRCRIAKVLSQHDVLASRYNCWAKNKVSLLLLSECISLLHKSFNPIKKRKRAILCPLPLLLLLLHPGCHLFLIISFRIGEQITRSFIPLKSDLGREKAQCRKMTCQSADFELSVQICCPFEEKTPFSYYSPPILQWMPLSYTDLFVFREMIFPTVWKIPTANGTVWKSILIQHSLPTLQILNNAASRFTCSSLNMSMPPAENYLLFCSTCQSARAGCSDSEIEQHSWWHVTAEILYSHTLCILSCLLHYFWPIFI